MDLDFWIGISIYPGILLIIFLFWLMNRQQQGGSISGKHGQPIFGPKITKVLRLIEDSFLWDKLQIAGITIVVVIVIALILAFLIGLGTMMSKPIY
jgi:hypothetical protein